MIPKRLFEALALPVILTAASAVSLVVGALTGPAPELIAATIGTRFLL